MCGIVGVHFLDGKRVADEAMVRSMNDRIRHRGPDDSGEKSFGAVGIGMRRLSIIDLSTGHQPLANEDETVWTVFNGEIYNYRELRTELLAAGHRFKTSSDTEILVHGYEEWGDAFVERLNGMYGFAIWDTKRKRLLLARDRAGIKPIFYYHADGVFAFASEVKSLMALPHVRREVDLAGLNEFMTLEYTVAPRTLLKNVCKLRPGWLLTVENGRVEEKKYWRPQLRTRAWTEEEACSALRRELRSAVERQLVSDVPLGAFLSGGIDSSILVGLMAELRSDPVKTFSISFQESSYDESSYARLVAKRFKTEHYEFPITPDPARFLDDFIRYLDEPIGDVSVFPTFMVSQKARTKVTVALSGDGGDELFGGYDTYLADKMHAWFSSAVPEPGRRALNALAEKLPPTAKKKGLVNRFKRFMEGDRLPAAIRQYRWMSFLGDADRRALFSGELMSALGPGGDAFQTLKSHFDDAAGMEDDLNRLLYADVKVYLPEDILAKVDIASMANSLEARVPYLDHKVVELAFSMPSSLKVRGGKRKYILKKAFEDLLPPEILTRGKEGFSIPLKNWLKSELNDSLHAVLEESTIKRQGFFRWEAVRRLMDEHEAGLQNHAHRLWCLMVFQLWHRKYIEGAAQPSPSCERNS